MSDRAIETLLDEERRFPPDPAFAAQANAQPEIYDVDADAYWERVGRATRGHMGAGGDRITSGQSIWDNAMGESCAKALDRHPGALVLHVNGAFHSAHRGGAASGRYAPGSPWYSSLCPARNSARPTSGPRARSRRPSRPASRKCSAAGSKSPSS